LRFIEDGRVLEVQTNQGRANRRCADPTSISSTGGLRVAGTRPCWTATAYTTIAVRWSTLGGRLATPDFGIVLHRA
jgi:hypothetical protein